MTLLSSPSRIGITMDVDHDHDPDELLPFLSDVDIVLAEGYKRAANPKVEVFRPEVHGNLLCGDDEHLVAVVSQREIELEVPRFSPEDVKGLADLLSDLFSLGTGIEAGRMVK